MTLKIAGTISTQFIGFSELEAQLLTTINTKSFRKHFKGTILTCAWKIYEE